MDGDIPCGPVDVASSAVPYHTIPLWSPHKDGLFCIVDPEDYEWALQWRWRAKRSKGKAEKWYAVRNTHLVGRKQVTVFLHKEVCFRHHGLPPTPEHTIGDHQDGNSLNNRRPNLEWATVTTNRENRFGVFALQVRMAFKTNDPTRLLVGKAKRAFQPRAADDPPF